MNHMKNICKILRTLFQYKEPLLQGKSSPVGKGSSWNCIEANEEHLVLRV